jgi:predicted esterase
VSAQETADADYKVQGEYSGTIQFDEGELKYGVQVIALGDGKFSGVGYMGGLPGDGWDKSEPTRVPESTIDDDILALESDQATALITAGVATIKSDGEVVGKLKRVVRKSPTLGQRPPKNAIVLFAGKDSVDQWSLKGKPGQVTDDGLLMQGTASKRKFQDHQIHIEFLLPYMPKARGQGRGNSGIYIQGRYEVQMLDSFGLSGENNECGGIYTIRKPDENMCFPPMQWQTYDIDFHAAKFDGDKKVENAWMEVKHNGVTIHEHVELPKKTTAGPNNESAEPGFIYLQNHGNPVRYRNIWVVETKGDTEGEPPQASAPNQTEKKFSVQQPIEMDYLLYLPKEYESQEKWPLVLFLHGAGERGDDLDKVKIHGPPKMAAAGKEFPFIVVSPQCKSKRWWEPISLGALLDQVEKDYNVDSDRVYVTGLSMGGFGTWNLASHFPERFAAIAPICGGGDSTKAAYTMGKQVPIWVFHGAKDSVVPLSRSQTLVDAFEKKGADIQFTVYPEAGHDSWTETYNNPKLYDWMMSNSRKN